MVRPTTFRVIPALDTYPRVVAYAQTWWGKLLLLALFAAGVSLRLDHWPLLTAALAAMTFLPRFRPVLLTVATFASLALAGWSPASPPWPIIKQHHAPWPFYQPLAVFAVLAAFALYLGAVKRNREGWLGRRPVRNLLFFYVLLLLAVSLLPLTTPWVVYPWAVVAALGKYLWYFNYTLLDRHARDTPHLALQAGHYLPFWGGSATPFPKGAAYLRKIEAKEPRQLAICQLKGIKLLYWAILLGVLEKLLRQLCYGPAGGGLPFAGIPFSLHLPALREILHGVAAGTPYPWHTNWLALVANFFCRLLWFSVWGHLIIAGCRMAGYNALRNTYRPLQSASIAEFWNRFYYYFKELLVDNFFYPTFLRSFKRHPRLRLFFATFAAAGFGNVLYHFLRDIGTIADLGFWQALMAQRVYMFYGVVLSIAITLSQLYEKKSSTGASWLRRNIITPGYVVGFYCLLSIFDSSDPTLGLGDRFHFLLHLFNLHLA